MRSNKGLLFITQKVDKDDDVLGVYHEWIAKLAEKLEKVSVICLYRGRVELPDNVAVYSLGKESGPSRWKYLWRFYKYIWNLRREYDMVFVHMNPEYVILGWKLWRLFGKKIFLWYNHPLGGFRARLAINLADKVFCTSPFAFAARYKKTEIMPVGIDTERFRNLPSLRVHEALSTGRQESHKNSILYLGRISPIKKLEILIGASLMLLDSGTVFSISIVGAPSKPSEEDYFAEIKKLAEPLIKSGHISFLPPAPNYKTPEIYNSYDLSVNMTPSGSFDKAIIESMACETPVLVSNKSLRGVLPEELIFEENDADNLAKKIRNFFDLSGGKREKLGVTLREIADKNHSLRVLVDRIVSALNS